MPKINFAQVFIHYFSNKNRYATKVFLSDPHQQLENKMGRIFGIIEINTPSRENAKIIDQLIDAAEREYYSFAQENLECEEAFEKTLKNLNTLCLELISKDPAYTSSKRDAASIREKLNLVIGVVKGDKLLITAINTIGSFLIHKTKQEYKLIEIDGQSKGENPVSIFDSVISGTISESDYLFFCNHDVENFISKERIVKTITALPVNKAADYFKNSLLQHEGFNFAAIIIQSEPALTEMRAVPRSLSSIGTMNAGEMATEKLLSPSLLPNFTASIKDWTKKIKSKITPQQINRPNVIQPQITHVAEPSVNETFRNVHPHPAKKYLKQISKNAGSAMGQVFNWNKISQHLNNFGRSILSLINRIPNLSKILIAIVVLLGGFFIYATFLPHNQLNFGATTSQNPDLLAIEQLLNEADSKLIYNDKVAAKDLVKQSQDKLQTVKIKNNVEQDFANSISKKIDILVAKLRNITLIDQPTLLYSITGAAPANVVSMVLNNNEIYYFDQGNNQISKLDIISKIMTPVTGTFDGNLGKAHRDEHGIIHFITDKNKLYKIDNGKIIAIPLAIAAEDKIADFNFYNDRLYTLIPSKNQIYRHPSVDSGYGSGIIWLQQSGVNLAQANTITIDTSIWVSTSNGQVLNFFKGTQRAFKLGEIDPPLTAIYDLIKDPANAIINLLDLSQHRILIIGGDGALKTQYFSPTLTNLKSFTVNQTSHTLYVANGNDIYALIVPEIK